MNVNAFWPPERFHNAVTHEHQIERNGQSVTVRYARIEGAQIETLCDELRLQQQRVLKNRSIESIVETLDRTAQLWLQPAYEKLPLACKAISIAAGFSYEMVAHAIELEQISSQKDDILAALTRELGAPEALDRFVSTTKGRSHAWFLRKRPPTRHILQV